MRKIDRMSELPEVTRYTKYYEHDGMLRAYANRAMFLAMIFGVLAMASLGFAIYVRLQPPTVIRVDSEGNASVVGGPRAGKMATFSLSADASSADPSPGVAPTDLEGRAVVRHFLDRYLTYTPDSVDRNLAEALNMMTANLRVYSMNKLRDGDTVDLHGLRRKGSSPCEECDRGHGSNRRAVQLAPGRNGTLGSESERTTRGRVRRATDGRRARGRAVAKERPRQGQALKVLPPGDTHSKAVE